MSRSLRRGYGWLCIVLGLGIGMICWWWTLSKQQELEYLLQEKAVQTQSLAKIQERLGFLKHYQKEKQRLSASFEKTHAQEVNKQRPMTLLDGVSRSVDGLDIWLDRVQIVDQVVELRGQSFTQQDVGNYLNALENHHVITSLPFVEILDPQEKDSGQVFSFIIRFPLEKRGTA